MKQESGWVEQAYLKASNADVGDHFGKMVAIDGDHILVSATSESSDGTSPDNNLTSDSGAAYLFVRVDNNWTQQGYLKASNPGVRDLFGNALALDGTHAIVGAYQEAGNGSSPDDNSAENAGAAYIFNILPEFESAPTAPGPLMMQGIARTPVTTFFSVSNRSSDDFLLNVGVRSITAGYSVTSGLPVFGLPGSAEAVTVTVQCDNPGTSPANGTLVLETNEFGIPTYSYNLVCQEEIVATETPVPTPPPTTETPAPVTGRVAPFDGQVIATGDEYILRFQWTPIEGAEWYHVFVWTGEADGIIHDQWYEAAAVCADGLCTTSQEIWLMNAGEFSWWMTHWSETIGDGFIDLYAESRFSVTMPAPGTITGLSPVGDVAGSAETLTLSWAKEANTLWYQVWTGTADYQSTSFYEWLYAPDVCSGETCSISIPMPAVGDHKFWLQAWNPAGLADWQQMTVYSIVE